MDIDNIFFFAILINLLLIFYFAVIWYQNKSRFKGGFYFILSRVCIISSYLGASIWDSLSLFLPNLVISSLAFTGNTLITISLYKFTAKKISKALKSVIVFSLLFLFSSEFFFSIKNPDINTRIFFMNLIVIIPYLSVIPILTQYFKHKSFPGTILLITSLLIILQNLLRSASVLIAPIITDSILVMQNDLFSLSLIFTLLLPINWPISFVLLIMEELKKDAQKNAEREVLLKQGLERSDRLAAIGTLSSGIAHEINNPNNYIRLNAENLFDIFKEIKELNNLSSYSEMEIQGIPVPDLNDSVLMMTKSIVEGSQRIAILTKELKEYARPDDNEVPQSVHIKDIVDKASRIIGNTISKSTDHFIIEVEDKIPAIYVRPHKIEQVIINLLNNACQALSDKSQIIKVSAEYIPEKRGITLSVEDQGSGIPKSHLNRIRDPFFTSRRASGGTGMGLAICDRIIQNHRGSLMIHSQEGSGTTVSIYLPETGRDDE